MNVRIVGVGRVGVYMLCVYDREERERGVGASVNATMVAGTLAIISLTDSIIKLIRKAAALARVLPTLAFSCAENAARVSLWGERCLL